MKYFEAEDSDCITSLGVGKTLELDLQALFSWRRSHTSLNFSSFSSLATNPAGLIHCAASVAQSYWLGFFVIFILEG